ncbi:LOW QUALITY PROTEIN: ATP-binding cassette (ABC) Superfamily [Phytophthora palmivora]|uniref:ATP-binding cassette (ABC) Superfamily n=1 Tax=Phytophthora palmivora TaxID=4796 RepID=A0A2P4YB64_9STRA|nr:LOW QUALITY PROTEIN: ATP-binding cassette (ABC) Superfamily [Phytophthora palmivora]
MKLLSGLLPLEKNVSLEGEITYNDEKQQNLIKRLSQFTLEFAHAFSGGGVSKRGEKQLSRSTPEATAEALEAIKALYAHYPEVIMKQLGLENCIGTIVGSGMLCGVSGGECKRVTTGEIITGLDSAATYDITSTQCGIAKTLQNTVMIALLQPTPDIFKLFGEVMIMKCLPWFSQTRTVLLYFESLGFVCPPGYDVADILLDLGTHGAVQAGYNKEERTAVFGATSAGIPEQYNWAYAISPQ